MQINNKSPQSPQDTRPVLECSVVPNVVPRYKFDFLYHSSNFNHFSNNKLLPANFFSLVDYNDSWMINMHQELTLTYENAAPKINQYEIWIK